MVKKKIYMYDLLYNDGKKTKILFYAWTDSKKLSESFKESRDMDKFILKTVKYDDDLFEKLSEDAVLAELCWEEFSTCEYMKSIRMKMDKKIPLAVTAGESYAVDTAWQMIQEILESGYVSGYHNKWIRSYVPNTMKQLKPKFLKPFTRLYNGLERDNSANKYNEVINDLELCLYIIQYTISKSSNKLVYDPETACTDSPLLDKIDNHIRIYGV